MAASLHRMSISYNLSSGAEVASNSLWFLNAAGASDADFVSRTNALFPAFWTSVRSRLASTTSVRRVRCDSVDVSTGRTISGADATVPTDAGSSSTSNVPLQCAPVLTLRTALSGASYRGRLYLPPPTVPSATGDQARLVLAYRTETIGAYQVLLNGFKAGTTSFIPVVFSRKQASASPIIAVEVGDVLDTMRSRRDRLVEIRTSGQIL